MNNQFMLCNNEKCKLNVECLRYIDTGMLSEYFQGNYDKTMGYCEYFVNSEMMKEGDNESQKS